jgi:outer membrane protein assembly factor BamB
VLEDRTAPTAVDAPSGLISWWTGNNTAADVLGAHNGTLVGGTTFSQGKVGQAFSLDGVNDTVTLAGTFGGGPEATIEAWVKSTGGTGDLQAIVSATDSNFVHLQLGASGAIVAYTDGGTVSIPVLPLPPSNVYQHIAFSIKSGDSRLYLNGSLVGTSTVTFSTILPTSSLRIGSGYQGGRFFMGGIDEVSYYNRALTAGEVLGIYKAGSDGKAFSPVAVDFPTVAEGSAGTTTPVTFTIQRTGSLSGSLTVNWATADDTATAGADYVAASGQVTFLDGEATRTVQVTVNGDDAPEPHETFKLILTPTGGTPVMGLATIRNDDIGISVNNVTVTEGNTHLASLGTLVDRAADGDLAQPTGMAIGPDGNLYVGSRGTNEVLRYSAATGSFLGVFVTSGSGGLAGPAVEGLSFRPDGKLYVASRDSNSVLRYDATTGAFYDTFVLPNSGGLQTVKGMTFGPDGNLYLSSGDTNQVLRYSGTTGAFMGVFVAAGSGA